MRTMAKVPLELVQVEYVPEQLEQGKFYYTKEYKSSNHLCVCGCGQEVPIPIKQGEWNITIDNGKFSITPSLQLRMGCQSHYIITNSIANIV